MEPLAWKVAAARLAKSALPRPLRTLVEHRRWYSERVLAAVLTALWRPYRRMLPNVAFIGVTGSCAKSTTKELIHGVLSTRFGGVASDGNWNQPWHLVQTLVRLRPGDRYSVQEIAAGHGPHVFERSLALVRPRIGVVTNIGTDHIRRFGTIEAIARQKRRLVEVLPRDGVAILNADDPRVIAMRDHTRARVVSYGLSADADLRAEHVRSEWPSRLSFTVHRGGATAQVRTQLVGEHWVYAALATIAVACEMGMPLDEAAQALAAVPPFPGRMSPVERADGVAFIRDDGKAPLWTFDVAYRTLRDARATRKWIVIGTIADYLGDSTPVYREVARAALDVADRVMVVGPRSGKCRNLVKGDDAARLTTFVTVASACDHLRRELRPGDLVLIKATETSGLGPLVDRTMRGTPDRPAERPLPPDTADAWAIIGLGNPEPSHDGTPHNVGAMAVARMAGQLGGHWTAHGDADVCTTAIDGVTVHLVRPRVPMNRSGEVVRRLATTLGFAPTTCVLVHDELALPLGKLRARAAGGDGGHLGVRSVLEAFDSVEFRRVKIGVGPVPPGEDVPKFVLRPFPDGARGDVERACAEGALRAIALLREGVGTRRAASPSLPPVRPSAGMRSAPE